MTKPSENAHVVRLKNFARVAPHYVQILRELGYTVTPPEQAQRPESHAKAPEEASRVEGNPPVVDKPVAVKVSQRQVGKRR